MPRIPLRAEPREAGAGRCGPGPERAPAPAGTYRPGIGSIIPPEWVGLDAESGPARPATVPATPPAETGGVASSAPPVIASLGAAAAEHVVPAFAGGESGACFVEPGRRCRASGRCCERGY